MPKIPDYICELGGGKRVRYSLAKRSGSPIFRVFFRGPDNRPCERATSSKAVHAAIEDAIEIIRKEYAPKFNTAWKDAITDMKRHMQAGGLRPGTMQQYEVAVNLLRKAFPDTHGPADITPTMAEKFKVLRSEVRRGGQPLAGRTIEGNLDNLSIVYSAWFGNALKIVGNDPFADVAPPRYDKKPPRVISDEERDAFFNWLREKWKWRLPLLFLEVKAALGCRIGELSRLESGNLKDGLVFFPADTTKGRESRVCKLPPKLFDELRKVAGPRYAWERFSDELKKVHKDRRANNANLVKGFSPARLVRWLQDQTKEYINETGATRFKLHNFRGTAMSRARAAEITESDAAILFGCNPQTMREHYISLQKAELAEKIFEKMNPPEG